jgi:branched-chain amino acid transport system substrate-binding protein
MAAKREKAMMSGLSKLGVAALACLVGSASAHAQSDGKIRIGVQIAQTGNASTLGVPGLKGIRFAAETINKRGGLDVGGKKYQIEIVARDDGSSPETARAVVQQLITEEKVDFLIAGVYSNIVASVMPIAERYGVPTISTFAYSPKVIPANAKYSFVNVMSISDQFQGPLEFLKENGVNTVALAASNDDLGEGFVRTMPRYLEQYGLKLAGVERFETNTTNFAPIMARLKATKADALIVEAGDPLSYQFRVAQKQYQACKTFKFTVYEYGPPLQPDWVNSTKAAGIGGVGQSFWWKTQKGFEDRWFGNNAGFMKAYKEGTGEDAVWSTAQGVQSMTLMALAIEKAGKVDRDAVAKAFLELDGSTLFGPIKFDPVDHFNRGFVKNQLVIQQQGPTLADAKIIHPASQAEAKWIPDSCGE